MALADRFESGFIFGCNFLLATMCAGGGGEVNLSMFIGADKFSEIYF